MKTRATILLLGILLTPALAAAHCEVPCGIYDDEARIAQILEDATTIEKAMNQVAAMGEGTGHDPNQIVRWVVTKEEHATRIQHVVSQYFLTQRIKPDQDGYVEKLQSLHRLLLLAMKCKQTTDPAGVAALRAEVEVFRGLYFGGEH